MRRRTMLGLVAGASGLSAFALGSGAFSTVRADRELTVTVENDFDAYLGLMPLGSGYADVNEGERSRLDGGPGAQVLFRFPAADERHDEKNPDLGLGRDSVYRFVRDAGEGPDGTAGLLEITNQGTNPVTIYSEQPDSSGPSVGIFLVDETGQPLGPDGSGTSLDAVDTLTEDEGVAVGVGESVRVGFEIDTHGVDDVGEYHETIRFVAEADDV